MTHLIAAFLAGVLGTMVVESLAQHFVGRIPVPWTNQIAAFASSPWLYIKLLTGCEEKQILKTLRTLFDAWRTRNPSAYSNCWAENATRLDGVKSLSVQSKHEIVERFENAVEKYPQIVVESFCVTSLKYDRPSSTATVAVRYRMRITRVDFDLPLHENGVEMYKLSCIDDEWLIVANIDHYSEIS